MPGGPNIALNLELSLCILQRVNQYLAAKFMCILLISSLYTILEFFTITDKSTIEKLDSTVTLKKLEICYENC